MKYFSRPLLFLSALACLAFTGCGTVERTLYRRQVITAPPAPISTNTVLVTNIVTLLPPVTNALTGVVTPPVSEVRITPETRVIYGPPQIVTNLVENPAIAGALQTTGILPIPFAGTIAFALSALYGAYAAVRNKRKGEQLSAALVKSVEAARDFLKETPEGQKLDGKFTAILQSHQDAAGVLREVNSLLAKYVEKT